MLNKFGAKVRLHFRLDSEQLWIGTKGIEINNIKLDKMLFFRSDRKSSSEFNTNSFIRTYKRP